MYKELHQDQVIEQLQLELNKIQMELIQGEIANLINFGLYEDETYNLEYIREVVEKIFLEINKLRGALDIETAISANPLVLEEYFNTVDKNKIQNAIDYEPDLSFLDNPERREQMIEDVIYKNVDTLNSAIKDLEIYDRSINTLEEAGEEGEEDTEYSYIDAINDTTVETATNILKKGFKLGMEKGIN